MFVKLITIVFFCHCLCQSLLNPLYEGSLPPVYVITLLMGIWAFFSSGGSLHNLTALCTRKTLNII